MRAVRRATNVQIRRLSRPWHHINPITAGRVESFPNFTLLSGSKQSSPSYLRPSTTINMSSAESVIQSLAGLSIKPAGTVSHNETTSPATWREALNATSTAPKSFELIKTLVFKPKTAKTATPIPVVVIARDETETSSGALGKKLNLKELRLASEDLLKELFALDKNSRTCIHRVNLDTLTDESRFKYPPSP